MPREKEPMFFAVYGQGFPEIDLRTGGKAAYVVEELDEYLDLFRRAGDDQLIGEASTWYLYRHQSTIGNIRRIYGEKARDLKILILLRDPAERAWSHYLLKRRNGEEILSFEKAIEPDVIRERSEKHYAAGFDYIGFGRYFRQVESYLASFPRIKILLFEEMREDMARAARDVCDFLDVEALPFAEPKKLNVSGAPKNRFAGALANFVYRPRAGKSFFKFLLPYRLRADLKYRLSEKFFRPERMDAELRQRLTKTYRDDILGLGPLIRKDLSRWWPSPPGER